MAVNNCNLHILGMSVKRCMMVCGDVFIIWLPVPDFGGIYRYIYIYVYCYAASSFSETELLLRPMKWMLYWTCLIVLCNELCGCLQRALLLYINVATNCRVSVSIIVGSMARHWRAKSPSLSVISQLQLLCLCMSWDIASVFSMVFLFCHSRVNSFGLVCGV